MFNYTCTSCDVSAYLNLLLATAVCFSVDIANETVHRRGGKPLRLGLSAHTQYNSNVQWDLAYWTCYKCMYRKSRLLYDEVGSLPAQGGLHSTCM